MVGRAGPRAAARGRGADGWLGLPPGLIVEDVAPACARPSLTVAVKGAALPTAPGPDFPVAGGRWTAAG
ncbi:MAG: hypothetical protein OXF55_12510 [Caldilineaceae bacterium]|nr:hypothetical protein [Caldilineaceae bacterium]